MQKAAPAAVIIEGLGNEAELRRQMRAKNGVSELGASTSQVMFSQAPTGTFGFIVPKLLGLALLTQSPDLAVARVVLELDHLDTPLDGETGPEQGVRVGPCGHANTLGIEKTEGGKRR